MSTDRAYTLLIPSPGAANFNPAGYQSTLFPPSLARWPGDRDFSKDRVPLTNAGTDELADYEQSGWMGARPPDSAKAPKSGVSLDEIERVFAR